MKKKKSSFTLIEVLVTLSLFALLSTILFSNYLQAVLLNRKSAKIKEITTEHAWAHQRISSTLGRLAVEKGRESKLKVDQNRFSLFLDKEGGLKFIYDNGIDKDPKYSGRVQGRVYLKNQTLYLKTMPLEDTFKKHYRSEVLFESVHSCTFEFYNPPPPKHLPVSIEGVKDISVSPIGRIAYWNNEFKNLPQSIKIILEKDVDGKSVKLIFPIPLLTPQIYLGEG